MRIIKILFFRRMNEKKTKNVEKSSAKSKFDIDFFDKNMYIIG